MADQTRGARMYQSWGNLGAGLREWATYGVNFFGGKISDTIFNPYTAAELAAAKLADYGIRLGVDVTRKDRKKTEEELQDLKDEKEETDVALSVALHNRAIDAAQFRREKVAARKEYEERRKTLERSLTAYPGWALAASAAPNSVRLYTLYKLGYKLADQIGNVLDVNVFSRDFYLSGLGLIPTAALAVYNVTSLCESVDWQELGNYIKETWPGLRDKISAGVERRKRRKAARNAGGNQDTHI